MTFGDFIKILNNSEFDDGKKIFPYIRDDIANKLLRFAGLNVDNKYKDEDLIPSYVTKWIDRGIPKNIGSYFTKGKFDAKAIIYYFKSHIKDICKILQDKFSLVEDGCIVDCDTENPDDFYRSLLEQFRESLGLPWTEQSVTEIKEKFEQLIYLYKFEEALGKYEQAISKQWFKESPIVFDEESITRISAFLKSIDADIIKPYEINYSEYYLYQRIREFVSLWKFPHTTPKLISRISSYACDNAQISTILKKIRETYNEIRKFILDKMD